MSEDIFRRFDYDAGDKEQTAKSLWSLSGKKEVPPTWRSRLPSQETFVAEIKDLSVRGFCAYVYPSYQTNVMSSRSSRRLTMMTKGSWLEAFYKMILWCHILQTMRVTALLIFVVVALCLTILTVIPICGCCLRRCWKRKRLEAKSGNTSSVYLAAGTDTQMIHLPC